MWTGRLWGIGRYGRAALAIIPALAGSSFAGTLTAGVSTMNVNAPIHAATQIADVWHSIWTLHDGVFDQRARASGYSASLSPFLFSTCKFEWCAWGASAFGGTSLTRTESSKFETPLKWRSSFSIAGSRVWSKVVKFSSNGIDVRLPLN
jgi:hypothetical protein